MKNYNKKFKVSMKGYFSFRNSNLPSLTIISFSYSFSGIKSIGSRISTVNVKMSSVLILMTKLSLRIRK